jgi:phosphatidylinositol alpha-mannosyltransferase
VIWYRSPSDPEIQGLLLRAWAFCLPSSYEGFGIPYLEAMAWGLPVVATPNPGAEALPRGGTVGCIAESARPRETLVRLLDDATLREHLAAAGRARAANFAWDVVCERYEEAYASARERWERRG